MISREMNAIEIEVLKNLSHQMICEARQGCQNVRLNR